jgi:hypothetical protein
MQEKSPGGTMGAAVVVAAVVRQQREIVEVFQGARATSPESARDPIELGLDHDRIFRGLIDRAVIRDAGNGRYYVDEPSWRAMGRTRRRAAFIVAAIAIALLGLGILVSVARVFPQ